MFPKLTSPTLISLILLIGSNVQAATNDDFVALRGQIVDYIDHEPDRHIPLLVRNSFHDLFLQDKAGLHGCIVKEGFIDDQENAGLDSTIKDLQKIVQDKFPNAGFSFGDVIAFAGKVAVETAYPCINIKFKFNRTPCSQQKPNVAHQAPSAFIDTITGLGRMFNHLENKITPEDLAILFAGAHGIKGARAGPTGWRGVFATVTSGKAFIATTFSSSWKFTTSGTLAQFFTGDSFDPRSSIIRLPSDLIFYPSKVPAGSSKDDKPFAKSIENKLLSFTKQDRSVFDQAFAKAYEKLLSIGDGNQQFVEDFHLLTCEDGVSPPSTTVSVAPPLKTSTSTVVSTSEAPSSTTSVSTLPETSTGTPPEPTATEPNSTTEITATEITATATCYGDDCEINSSTSMYPIIFQLLPALLFL